MPVLVNKETGLAENLPEDVAQSALTSNTHEVPLYDPEGNAVLAAHADAGELLNQGYRQPNPEELKGMLKTAKYSSTGEELKTAAEGAASGATFGLSTAAERALGVTPEAIRAREEVNPGIHALGEVAGLTGSMLTGIGEGAILEKAGAKVAEKAAIALPENFAGRVGSQAAKAAIENMMFQSGDEASKVFAGDPHQSVETAVTDIGLSGLIGGALGGGMGTVSELWNMGPGKKLNGLLGAITDRSGGLSPELKNAAGIQIPPEVEAALGDNIKAREGAQALMESNSKSGLEAQKLFTEFKNNANEGIVSALGKTPEEASSISDYEVGKVAQKQLANKIDEVVKPISEKYDKIEEQFKNAVISSDARAEAANKISQAIVDNNLLKGPSEASLKLANKVLEQLPSQATAQDIRAYVRGLSDIAPFGSETYQIGKQLKSILNELQEHTIVNGLAEKAPELLGEYQANQSAYKAARELIDNLNDRLHVGKFGGPASFTKALKEMAPEDVLRRLSPKGDVDMQKLLSEQFPEVAETARQHELNKVLKGAIGKGEDAVNATKLFKDLEKLSPEMKQWLLKPEQAQQLDAIKELLDRVPKKTSSIPDKTVSKLWSEVPASAAAMAAMALGHSGPLAYIMTKMGTLAGKEVPDAVKLAILKFLGSSSKVDAAGFRGAVHAAAAVLKGETLLNKAVGSVFNASKAVIAEPSAKEREKLDKQITELSQKPEKILDANSAAGHYLPEHQAASAELTMRAVQYLNSLKPKTDPLGVLDSERKPSKMEEATYNNALNIAQNPLLVLKSVKEGSITQTDITHLQNLYPSLYKSMQAKLIKQLVEANGKSLPYRTQLGMSMFMAKPLHSSMQPQSIMSAQNLGQQMAQPMAQAQPTKTGMAKLDKLAPSYMTPQQNRSMSRATRH